MLKIITAVVIFALMAAGLGWFVIKPHNSSGSTAAIVGSGKDIPTRYAAILCSQRIVTRMIDAYPQAHMTSTELGNQTIGQGLARFQSFQAAFPALIDPIIPVLKQDPELWNYINGLGRQSVDQISRTKRLSPGLYAEIAAFTKKTADGMKAICPQDFSIEPYIQDANHRSNGMEFMIGSIIGYLGKK